MNTLTLTAEQLASAAKIADNVGAKFVTLETTNLGSAIGLRAEDGIWLIGPEGNVAPFPK